MVKVVFFSHAAGTALGMPMPVSQSRALAQPEISQQQSDGLPFTLMFPPGWIVITLVIAYLTPYGQNYNLSNTLDIPISFSMLTHYTNMVNIIPALHQHTSFVIVSMSSSGCLYLAQGKAVSKDRASLDDVTIYVATDTLPSGQGATAEKQPFG